MFIVGYVHVHDVCVNMYFFSKVFQHTYDMHVQFIGRGRSCIWLRFMRCVGNLFEMIGYTATLLYMTVQIG